MFIFIYMQTRSERNRRYYLKNKEKISLRIKEYHKTNKEKIKNKHNKYLDENKDKRKETCKKYYKKNEDKIKEYQEYNKKNRNKYSKNRRKVDIVFKLKNGIATSIRKSLKEDGFKKKNRTHDILGCSIVDFKIYLELKFEPWMTWDNYGKYNGEKDFGWDIDHIIPTSSVKTEGEIIKLNHYTNLQPLCSYVNRYIKRDNI